MLSLKNLQSFIVIALSLLACYSFDTVIKKSKFSLLPPPLLPLAIYPLG